MNSILKKSFKASIPVMAGYIVLGSGFGILMVSKGFGSIWAILMSLVIYAGSMQFLAINLITSGATLLSAGLTALMVNARHLFYGITMSQKYKNAGKYKPYMIFALTDETYSIVCTTSDTIGDNTYSFYVSLFNHIYWVTGTVIGCVIGNIFTFNTMGIDFALTALFVTVFCEQWLTQRNHSYAICGVLVSVLCLVLFKPSGFLIPAMAGIIAVLTILKPKGDNKNE